MNDKDEIKAAKREASRIKQQREDEIWALRGPIAKRWRRCFWTWPFGHRYNGPACVGCGKLCGASAYHVAQQQHILRGLDPR